MQSTQLRQSVLRAARRVVVKLGTQVLSSSDSANDDLDLKYLGQIASQVNDLKRRGFEVTLVSSGAISAGCAVLGLAKRPAYVADLQAAAAVGQRLLMTRFHEAFERHGLEVAQILLTRDDFDDRGRFLNIRNCVTRLHELGCIPVVNENDTVAVEELRVEESDRLGTTMENDLLAAMICNALRADALILLSVVDGLLGPDGQAIDLVQDVAAATKIVADGQMTAHGRGGMTTKLEAARLVTEAGEIAAIAHGRAPNVLLRLLDGEQLGTVFVPADRKLDSRRRWIGMTKRASGTLTIDSGAAAALRHHGRSLLARGIIAAEGRFSSGAVLIVQDQAQTEIARGLTNYSATEIARIIGKKSNQFEQLLGRPGFPEVIHRDNLVLVGK